jgi:hypothetical protein
VVSTKRQTTKAIQQKDETTKRNITPEGEGDIDSNQRGKPPNRSHQGQTTQIIGTRGEQPKVQSKGKGKGKQPRGKLVCTTK